jgi:hypothetical protein
MTLDRAWAMLPVPMMLTFVMVRSSGRNDHLVVAATKY